MSFIIYIRPMVKIRVINGVYKDKSISLVVYDEMKTIVNKQKITSEDLNFFVCHKGIYKIVIKSLYFMIIKNVYIKTGNEIFNFQICFNNKNHKKIFYLVDNYYVGLPIEKGRLTFGKNL